MWFKNLVVYRLTQWNITPEALEEKLSSRLLQGCGSSDMSCMGWVSPKGDAHPLVHVLDQQIMLALGVEKKLLPSTVINQFAKLRAVDLEEQQGYKPGRKQMKEIKEAVTLELLPRAFSIQRKTYAWIDLANRWLVVDAASIAKADELIEMLFKSIDGIAMEPVRTVTSPLGAMTTWLAGEELPSYFTVDRDCELRGSGEEKATVRYVRHALEVDEISKHISSGKEVTKLAMTWADKFSFVLHENLQIKRLTPLDVLKEKAEGSEAEELFDADFAIMTGELQHLIPDLVEVLGGEEKPVV